MTDVTIEKTVNEVTVAEDAVTVEPVTETTTVEVQPGISDHGELNGLGDDDHPQYLQKAGGTMTGDITLAGDPDAALKAATKQYADAVSGTDEDAVHDNVAGEIAAVAEKSAPVDADLLLIEDSEDGNNKKRVQAGTLPGGASVTIDTRENILALSASQGDVAFATDAERFMVYDGAQWQEATVVYKPTSDVDMGYEQNSSKTGYGEDYVTDKRLSNVLIGDSAREENGGLRVDVGNDPDTLEVFLREAWQAILYDLTVENDDLRHTPLGEEIYVWRGDSVAVGLNGRPIIQEYDVSMGSHPPTRTLNGGSF